MNILKREVEDEPFNYTRFMILAWHEPLPSDAPHKTSLVFAVRHTPGVTGFVGQDAYNPAPLRLDERLDHAVLLGHAADPLVALDAHGRSGSISRSSPASST